MKKAHKYEVNMDNLENNRKIQLAETDGDLHIVIKNPYLNSRALVRAGENVICEEINKLNLSTIKCDKCHQNLDLNTKLQLEKLLNCTEDTDFKEDITKRLDTIEQLLTKILTSRSIPKTQSVRVNPPCLSKPKNEYIEPENVFPEEQYEEEHLVEESEDFGYEEYEEKPVRNIKEVLANVNKRFPISSTQAMVNLNQDLISDSVCLEEVVAYFRYLDHKISPIIPENTKILRKIVDDETLRQYNWSGVSGKAALRNFILFSKIIYITWGSDLKYEDYESIIRQYLLNVSNRTVKRKSKLSKSQKSNSQMPNPSLLAEYYINEGDMEDVDQNNM